MSKLTGTHSEVSAIDFTTLTTVPGTLKVHGAPIQILDLRVPAFLSTSGASIVTLLSQRVSSKVQMMAEGEVDKVCPESMTYIYSLSYILLDSHRGCEHITILDTDL